MAHRLPVGEEHALGVHRHVGVPFLLGEVDHGVHRGDARVGGEQIEAAHPLGGGAEHVRRLRCVGDIQLEGACRVAEAVGEVARAVEADVGDGDAGALAREGLHDGTPDAGRRAGDERPPSGQQSATLVHDSTESVGTTRSW